MTGFDIIGATICITITWLVYRHFAIKKIIALEKSLPSGVPTECAKCGNSESNRLGMVKSAPVFHSPNYWERSIVTRTPEHLSFSCWNCSHRVMAKPGQGTKDAA